MSSPIAHQEFKATRTTICIFELYNWIVWHNGHVIFHIHSLVLTRMEWSVWLWYVERRRKLNVSFFAYVSVLPSTSKGGESCDVFWGLPWYEILTCIIWRFVISCQPSVYSPYFHEIDAHPDKRSFNGNLYENVKFWNSLSVLAGRVFVPRWGNITPHWCSDAWKLFYSFTTLANAKIYTDNFSWTRTNFFKDQRMHVIRLVSFDNTLFAKSRSSAGLKACGHIVAWGKKPQSLFLFYSNLLQFPTR